ncbi:MAG: hypothetical protein KF886_22085 [Candidatus Hydrogenedentes bacterium]|nr:hypothetical protein [Candidatus Hydrogenedentota bacterium]
MHIGINTLPLDPHPFPHHAHRYLARVLACIRKEKQAIQFSCLHEEGRAPGLPELPAIPLECKPGGLWRRGGANLDAAIAEHKIDLLLSAIQTPYTGQAVPQVLLALDLFPWDRNPAAPGIKTIKKACAQARHIIAPSEHVRRRCLEVFEASMEKIVVATPGVSTALSEPATPFVEKPYIVFLYDPLTAPLLDKIRAALDARIKEFPQTHVVVGPALPEEPAQWGPRVVRIEQCPDNHLGGLYREADFVLYAGPDDGSGLRVLEGLAAGAPVLAAGSRGVMENAGDAPIYFNGESLDAYFQSMKRILAEGGHARNKRIHTGQQIAARFRWDKTMWKVLSTFKAG